jgi:hypothetical protein
MYVRFRNALLEYSPYLICWVSQKSDTIEIILLL